MKVFQMFILLLAVIFSVGCASGGGKNYTAVPLIDYSQMDPQGNVELVVKFAGNAGSFPAAIQVEETFIEGDFLAGSFYVFRFNLPEGSHSPELDVFRHVDWCDKAFEVVIEDESVTTYIYAEFEFYLPEEAGGALVAEWKTEVTETERLTW